MASGIRGRRRRSSTGILVFLAISILVVSQIVSCVDSDPPKTDVEDDDEDLSFLEEDDSNSKSEQTGDIYAGTDADSEIGGDEGEEEEGEEEEGFPSAEDEELNAPQVDDKDVVVLADSNFTDFVSKRKHVLVEFYAPWCGHCQALAPEFADAATHVKEEMAADDVVLAKVDATEENDLAQKYDIQGFPTLLFFVDGEHRTYSGGRTKDGIISWIKKKIGPGIQNVETVEEGKKIVDTEDKLVLGFFDSLEGSESEELASASKLEDGVPFYQTSNPDVAKIFNLDSTVKRPSLAMIKKEDEKLTFHDGEFTKSAILNFISGNKLPLVNHLSRETAEAIFENTIKNQLLLFANLDDSQKILPTYREVAKSFKGKILFVYVQLDKEDVGAQVAEYFGVTGDNPKILAYTGNEDGNKYIYEGELTSDAIKLFGDEFLQDKLKPFLKSEPIPESNDGDVKIVVGKNFDEIVLDESKDVLLEVYAPWCGHCQSLEPTYNKLAKHLRDIDSLVVAKMDGTTNEHPRAKADGFPTLLFFPAGKKSFDPITVDTERTVVAFYKFMKKHASIPFKLQKPTAKPETSESVEPQIKTDTEGTNEELKDEL